MSKVTRLADIRAGTSQSVTKACCLSTKSPCRGKTDPSLLYYQKELGAVLSLTSVESIGALGTMHKDCHQFSSHWRCVEGHRWGAENANVVLGEILSFDKYSLNPSLSQALSCTLGTQQWPEQSCFPHRAYSRSQSCRRKDVQI